MQLVNRAIRERWPITDRHRQKVIDIIDQELHSEDNQNQMRAASLLAKIDALNLKQIEIDTPKTIISTNVSTEELMNQVREKLKSLGITDDIPIEAIEGLKARGLLS